MIFLPRAWTLLAFCVLLILLAFWLKPLLALVGLLDFLFLCAILVDWLRLPGADSIRIERIIDDPMGCLEGRPVLLSIASSVDRPLKIRVRDEPPLDFRFGQREFHVELPERGRAEIVYSVTPQTRGDHGFEDVFLRVEGAWGLVAGTYRVPLRQTARVFPSLRAVRQMALFSRRGLQRLAGSRPLRSRGQGSEFESLREYQQDDPFRNIDWRATARRGRPIVRQYRIERNQNVLLAMDCGRNMMGESQGARKFDAALDSAIMLSTAAIEAGDQVGFVAYSTEIERFVMPGRSRRAMGVIAEAARALQPRPAEADHAMLVGYLGQRWKKRSLIALFTDYADVESSRWLLAAVAALQRRHFVLCVAIADPRIDEIARQSPDSEAKLYERAVASQIVEDRQTVAAALRRLGAWVVDAEPERAPQELVAAYASIKAKGLI